MSNTFTGRGNLGAAPEIKTVQVGGEDRQVADLRIYFDRNVPDGNGGYEDKDGFWLNVSGWNTRCLNAARVLKKGMRVRVEGTLGEDAWEKDGQQYSRLDVTAQDITLDLGRVTSVTMQLKQSTGNQAADNPAHDIQATATDNAQEAAYG
ncbi:single-stranded DNA-binding protein [Salinisphaera orenii]|uniref:single-stranded DNA-binding protein n=1 Tax=Salinisphaera orenii TaxID=856731 RepID=UPI000DBE2EA3